MPPSLKLNAVAFVSPQNHPILIRTFNNQDEHAIKYHYIAHTSLDVIEERGEFSIRRIICVQLIFSVAAAGKAFECYLGLLFTMEDVAVYGYITPLKVKIILALALSDAVVKDAEIITIFKALHMAYYSSVSNPFLKLETVGDSSSDQATILAVGSPKWKLFRRRVDDINWAVGNLNSLT
ncbi:trafficking protein particle complex 2 [Crepidotus variabilis]|uniref:Trafficking protein particle complex subunit 2-like protein n=1 Tax=Crepidotus variabilis TaxID=179855 RepID=A0A9P6EU31_9AGAR|nr:trafficking protein particle complex 2 [Crepidotus variabilis]